MSTTGDCAAATPPLRSGSFYLSRRRTRRWRRPGAPSELVARALDAASCVLFLNTDALGPAARDVAAGLARHEPARGPPRRPPRRPPHLSAGLAPADLGVVTFYRSQLALLRQSLHRGAGRDGVELHTADRLPGPRQVRPCWSASCGGQRRRRAVGDLLRDWRRVNVAVTRARSKLVMVGSARTLAAGGGEGEGAEVLRSLVALCRERGWMVDLRQGEMDGLLGVEWTQGGSTAASSEVREGVDVDQRMGLKRPGRVCRAGEKAVVGKRPILKDILNEVT